MILRKSIYYTWEIVILAKIIAIILSLVILTRVLFLRIILLRNSRKYYFYDYSLCFFLNFKFQILIFFPLKIHSLVSIIILSDFKYLSLEILSTEQLKIELSNENRTSVMGRRNRQLRFGDWGRTSNEAQSFVSCLDFGAWLAIRLSVDKDLRVAKKLVTRSFVRWTHLLGLKGFYVEGKRPYYIQQI